MICQYYGKPYKLKDVKHNLSVSKLGVSIKDLRNCLHKAGFKSFTVNIGLDDIYEMPLPAILFLNYGHYVILEKIRIKKDCVVYHIIDPSFGRLALDEEVFCSRWLTGSTGLSIILEPDELFHEKHLERSDTRNGETLIRKNVTEVLKKNKRRFATILLFTMLLLISNWAMPLLLKENIDKGIMQKDFGLLWKILLFQFMFAISYLFSGSLSEILKTKLSLDLNIDLNRSYFKKILNLPISYYDTKFKSDLISGIHDQNRVSTSISNYFTGLVIMLLNILVFSTLLIVYNYQIFICFIFFTVAAIIYTLFFFKQKKFIDYSLFSLESENRNNIYELIMGITEVKINSAEKTKLANWMKTEEKLKKIKIKAAYIDFFMSNGNSFIQRLRDIFLIGMASFMVIKQDMTMGEMLMISYVLGQLSGPFNELIHYTQELQRSKLSFDRLSDVYHKEEEVLENRTYAEIGTPEAIVLQNLSFRYSASDTEDIIKNVSLKIPKNKTTAIVGASGSGKSTLLKLLLGFYYTSDGNVMIGDNNIVDVNLKTWRSRCGVILQEGYIFSGSVMENITLSSTRPDPDLLTNALKVAELFDKIESLPMKHNTKIGEAGISLSGGEKQRLLIARAVYKNPDYVFLDEATSSMDSITERKIMHNLKYFLQNRTAVIIAHRLSTIKNADHIVVMKNGEIAEQGTHHQLLEAGGEYYNLVKNQLEHTPASVNEM
jgi:ATP-binding cassette subfamily B protein